MRGKNAAKNLIFYLVYEVLVFALGIIFPRLIIGTFGSEVNGLTSTITRMLALLNLIQAGAVGAAIFQMYGPVAKNDKQTQSAIIYSSKRYYNKIVIIYVIASLIIGVFYSFRLQSENLSFYLIFWSFIVLTINGVLILRFNSICDIFISSHQKKYLLTISMIANQFVYYGLLSIILIFKLHFILMYLAYLCGGVVNVIVNLIFYSKMAKEIIVNNPENKNFKIPDRRALMLTSIGSEVVTLSPTIIVSTFLGLVPTSIFSIYAVIFTSMKTLINSIQLSFSPIFGNITKTADDNKIRDTYDLIELITIIIGSIASVCVGFLIMPFISLYTRNIADVNYYYPVLGVFVVLYVMIFSFRTAFSFVSTVYGLFKKICVITLVFGGLGIIISVFCTILFGMPYVMIGLLFNQFACSIATLIITKRDIKWFSLRNLVIRTLFLFSITCFGMLSYFMFNPHIDSWGEWLVYAICVGGISIVLIFLYCIIFEGKQIKSLLLYIKSFFINKKMNKSGGIDEK